MPLLTAANVPPRVAVKILGHSQIAAATNADSHVVQDTQREAVSHGSAAQEPSPVVVDRPR
ncbi:hypothetical protein ACFFTQ_07485 [Streptomyces roseofulvus]|uniref:hypothetical protein n=1 Tax=Streptomyces roseofulvus TaxID=33902 RepID=UPI0035E6E322